MVIIPAVLNFSVVFTHAPVYVRLPAPLEKPEHMPKTELIQRIIDQLEQELATVVGASQQAHESATHSENVAENKYDTLGLEAAYLAHGLSLRALELQNAILRYRRLSSANIAPQAAIQVGTLVSLEAEDGSERLLFLGPEAGGMRVEWQGRSIRVVTPTAPLGKAVLKKRVDDALSLQVNGVEMHYLIVAVQ